MPRSPRSRITRTPPAPPRAASPLAAALAACSSSTSAAPAATSPSAAAARRPRQRQPRPRRRRCSSRPRSPGRAWAPQDKQLVAAFEKDYPNVKVNLVNAGTGTTEYTKLQNAIKAGSGVPDVAQIEYYALPQFALGGLAGRPRRRRPEQRPEPVQHRPWDSVQVGGKLFGLPQDTGPMALFYNKTVFDKYGLTVPTTWAQFAADAAKLHAANPKEYLTNDTGDPGFTT